MVEFVCCKYIRNHRIPKKYRERKNRKPFSFLFHEPVQKMGVEPTRYYYHTDLNRARLPIPPLLRFALNCFVSGNESYYKIGWPFCQHYFKKNFLRLPDKKN